MQSWSGARSWDTSKFVRIAVDWLLRSDIGEVIKKIVDEGYADYQIPKKPSGRKKTQAMKTSATSICFSLSLTRARSVLPG
jgi:hypothetical protein